MMKNRWSKLLITMLLTLLALSALAGCSTPTAVMVSSPAQAQEDTLAFDEDTVEISVQQASVLRDQGVFVLDVRQPEEWQEVHIPGATLIPLGELQQRLDEVPADQTIVVVCRSGNRSMQGRGILADAGFAPVYSMKGGMTAWRLAGLETESGE